MKLAVFDDYRIGVVDGDSLFDVTSVLPDFLERMPKQRMNWLIEHWSDLEEPIRRTAAQSPGRRLGDVALLAPTPCPPHVFAAPANYRAHIGELGDRTVTKKGRSAREQGFFLKAPGSIIGPGGTIHLPKGSTRRFDHESELAVVIGRHGRDIARDDAMRYVFGYSCLVDATMRIESGTFEEERSMRKSFHGFTPIGPYIVTADEVRDPQNLDNRLHVNDTLKQQANTRDMIVGVAELIELISSVLPIQPGDVIASGTPEGVGPFVPGDEIRIAIEQVGEMRVFAAESPQTAPRAY